MLLAPADKSFEAAERSRAVEAKHKAWHGIVARQSMSVRRLEPGAQVVPCRVSNGYLWVDVEPESRLCGSFRYWP